MTSTPLSAPRLLPLWPLALLPLVGNCTVITGLVESEETEASKDADPTAGPVDGGNQIDATQTAFCGPSLPGSIAYFSFEDADGQPVVASTIAEGPDAIVQQLVGNQLDPGELQTTGGPSGCGSAASMPAGAGSVMQLLDAEMGDVRSVDFWARIDTRLDPEERTGLLSKDQNTAHNGDFEISVYHESASGQSYIILRIQRLTPDEGQAFRCSPPVNLDQWHHIAASIDGSPAQLFVDGALASHDIPISDVYGPGAECGGDTGISSDTTRTSENDNDWMVAGLTGLSPNTLAYGLFAGSIDELRFRSVGFSQSEAAAVFGTGR